MLKKTMFFMLLILQAVFPYGDNAHREITNGIMAVFHNNNNTALIQFLNSSEHLSDPVETYLSLLRTYAPEPDELDKILTDDEINTYSSLNNYNSNDIYETMMQELTDLIYNSILAPFKWDPLFGILPRLLVKNNVIDISGIGAEEDKMRMLTSAQHTYVSGDKIAGNRLDHILIAPYAAEAEYNMAKELYHDPATRREALRRLGRALHYVQDLTVPHHDQLVGNIPDLVQGVIKHLEGEDVTEGSAQNAYEVVYVSNSLTVNVDDPNNIDVTFSGNSINDRLAYSTSENGFINNGIVAELINIRNYSTQPEYMYRVDGWDRYSSDNAAGALVNRGIISTAIASLLPLPPVSTIITINLLLDPTDILHWTGQLIYAKHAKVRFGPEISPILVSHLVTQEIINSTTKWSIIGFFFGIPVLTLTTIATVETVTNIVDSWEDLYVYDIGYDDNFYFVGSQLVPLAIVKSAQLVERFYEEVVNSSQFVPVYSFTANKMMSFEPASIAFTLYKDGVKMTSIPETMSIAWDFGDGNTSTDINPVHNYTSGAYPVMATIYDSTVSTTQPIAELSLINPIVVLDKAATLFLPWTIDSVYNMNDIVHFEGNYYMSAKNQNTSSPGITETDWQIVDVSFNSIANEWKQPTGAHDAYPINSIVIYEGSVYISLIDNNGWSPIVAPNLWQKQMTLGSIEDWQQPTGAHDSYNIGDRVIFNGACYESLIGGNTLAPDVYPAGWKLITILGKVFSTGKISEHISIGFVGFDTMVFDTLRVTPQGVSVLVENPDYLHGAMFTVRNKGHNDSVVVDWYGVLDQNHTNCTHRSANLFGNGAQINNITTPKLTNGKMLLNLRSATDQTYLVDIEIFNWRNGPGCE